MVEGQLAELAVDATELDGDGLPAKLIFWMRSARPPAQSAFSRYVTRMRSFLDM